MAIKILERERSAILNSLSAGVVPRIGLQHIQVGRKGEVQALLEDLKRVESGSAAVRFVVGRFGAGKSFFLNLVQTVALERKFVVVRADFTTDRRLHATDGKARSLYGELMKNVSTRSKPDGGALANLIEKWVSEIAYGVTSANGTAEDVERQLDKLCKPLQDLVAGYDFVTVLKCYYRGHLEGNEEKQACAIRWLRAEYTSKMDARRDLGVRTIIDDEAIYDYLKLFAGFVKIAGYAGLLVCLDELVVLSHRLNNRTARNNNYEAVLRIVNDCLQGGVQNLGFIFAATDDCLTDTRRGLYSYEALASRLAKNRFAQEGLVDLAGPVLNLANLTPEDCFVLLHNIQNVFVAGASDKPFLEEAAMVAYMESCQKRLGAAYYQTPRDTIKDFIGLLNVMQQNPAADWRQLIGAIKTTNVQTVDPSVAQAAPDDDDLASFKV